MGFHTGSPVSSLLLVHGKGCKAPCLCRDPSPTRSPPTLEQGRASTPAAGAAGAAHVECFPGAASGPGTSSCSKKGKNVPRALPRAKGFLTLWHVSAPPRAVRSSPRPVRGHEPRSEVQGTGGQTQPVVTMETQQTCLGLSRWVPGGFPDGRLTPQSSKSCTCVAFRRARDSPGSIPGAGQQGPPVGLGRGVSVG